jgi:hypothetical protein
MVFIICISWSYFRYLIFIPSASQQRLIIADFRGLKFQLSFDFRPKRGGKKAPFRPGSQKKMKLASVGFQWLHLATPESLTWLRLKW